MKQATRDRLNAINLRFYAEQADAFSATRAQPWRGFARVLEHAVAAGVDAPLRVLDIGCGNGRLFAFLRDRLAARLAYTGVDASARLLEHASALERGASDARFERADFVSEPPYAVLPRGEFELVALLGVLHHVPSEAARIALLAAAAARVAAGGLLAYTLWRCDQDPRFARRRARGQQLAAAQQLVIDDLDPGDHLLAFGDGGLRYCHLPDPAEAMRFVQTTGLDLHDRFHADAAANAGGNDYYVLRRS